MTEAPEVFHGVVKTVTYENESSGYRVLRVSVAGGGVEIVVGTCPRVAPTMEVRIVGRRVNDPRYGAQVQAESVTVVTPSTRAGLERFLSSGLVRGIGRGIASRIVSHFGDDTLKILDEGGGRLTEVKGVNKRVAKAASEAWTTQRHASNVLIFLQGHGITPGLANRIFRRYGARTMEIVQQSPFRLALEVPGVGFQTADRIAQAVGIAHDAPERLEAGVVHCLGEGMDAGHTFTLRADLTLRASRELAASEAQVDEAIDRAERLGPLVLDGVKGPDQRVFPAFLQECEASITARIIALGKEAGKPLPGHERAIEGFERATGITLEGAQREAVAAAAREKVLIVTGGPGVGKTTLVRAMLELFDRARLVTRLAAPTGRAAKRLSESTGHDATTLHRMLEVDPRSGRFLRDARRPVEADVFVIDEASMIDVALGRSVLDAVPLSSRLILVGDVDQLPSVGPGALLRDLIKSQAVPVVRLHTIFRQARASLIVEGAHRIREGKAPVSAADEKGDFFLIPRTDPRKARETVLQLVSQRIPDRFGLDPSRDIQVLSPMRKGEAGVEALNEALEPLLNRATGPQVTRGGRALRVGDKVMQLKNDYTRDVYNGDIGFVSSIDPALHRLTVRLEDDREIAYEEDALDALTLAYAVSIHKSQGSEYPAVVIPWLRQHFVMLSRNLLYTAVTRGKRLVVLVADPRAIEVALTEERREERRTSLAERLRAARSLD